MQDTVSDANLEECIASANYWCERLPHEMHYVTNATRYCAVISAVLSAATSVAVWPLISQSTELWAQSVTSAVAFCTALVALLPVALGYQKRRDDIVEAMKLMGPAFGNLREAERGEYPKMKAFAEYHEAWTKAESLGLRVESNKRAVASPATFRSVSK